MTKLVLFVLFIAFNSYGNDQPIKFSVATPEIPPYVSLGENKQIEGLLIDMLNKVQANTGIEIEIFVMPWGRAINEVKKGSIDAILPTLWTKERTEYLVYPAQPFFAFRESVIVKRVEDDFEFTSLTGIGSNKIIGKMRSTLVDDEFDHLQKQSKLTVYETNKLEQALLMLTQGKLDLVAADGQVATSTIKRLGLDGRFVLFPMQQDITPSYIAFSMNFAGKHDINKIMSVMTQAL